MSDRSCYFGDGVYDVAYAKDGVMFTSNEHIARFIKSCAAIDAIKREMNNAKWTWFQLIIIAEIYPRFQKYGIEKPVLRMRIMETR